MIRARRRGVPARDTAGISTGTQQQALRDLARCRTAALGGHVERCLDCGHERIAYNSCRNRHCPKCQALARARWLEREAEYLLPVEYHHVVFTLPAEAGRIWRWPNPAVAVRPAVPGRVGDAARGGGQPEAARRAGRRADGAAHLGPEPAPSSARALRGHRRRPVVRPAAASSTRRRAGCRAGRASSCRCACSAACSAASSWPGCAHAFAERPTRRSPARLADADAFAAWLTPLSAKDWVVYAKPPFGGPAQVLKYLARYTHRVAISNTRLVCMSRDGRVTFRYKDYADDHRLEDDDALRRGVPAPLRAARVAEGLREDAALRPAGQPRPRHAAGRVPAVAGHRIAPRPLRGTSPPVTTRSGSRSGHADRIRAGLSACGSRQIECRELPRLVDRPLRIVPEGPDTS